MRHRVSGRKLNRDSEHRRAMLRNAAQSLFEHGQIVTTVQKAKEVRRFAERLITLARKARAGSLAARRRIIAILGDRAVIPADRAEDYDMMTDGQRNRVVRAPSGRRWRAGGPKLGMEFTAEAIVHRLIETVAARYENRPGGYTRIVRLGRRRIGDSAPKAILQLVGEEESPGSAARRGRRDRQRKAEIRRRFLEKALSGSRRPEEAPDEAEANPAAEEPEASAEQQAPGEQEGQTDVQAGESSEESRE